MLCYQRMPHHKRGNRIHLQMVLKAVQGLQRRLDENQSKSDRCDDGKRTFQDFPQPAKAHLYGRSSGDSPPSPWTSLRWSISSLDVAKHAWPIAAFEGQHGSRPQA